MKHLKSKKGENIEKMDLASELPRKITKKIGFYQLITKNHGYNF